MAKMTIELKVRVSWWVRPFIKALAVFVVISRMGINEKKVGAFIAKHGCKVYANSPK